MTTTTTSNTLLLPGEFQDQAALMIGTHFQWGGLLTNADDNQRIINAGPAGQLVKIAAVINGPALVADIQVRLLVNGTLIPGSTQVMVAAQDTVCFNVPPWPVPLCAVLRFETIGDGANDASTRVFASAFARTMKR